MEGASFAAPGAAVPEGKPDEPALKSGAISFISNIVIGVASTAPAYSLAATLGLIAGVAGLGLHSPAIMIVSFLPMLCIAAAYYYMNRADPDCGTTFTWVTRALGPKNGWFGGWGIIIADVLVMPSLAFVAGQYTFLLFGWHGAADNKWAVLAIGVAWIAVMTLICWKGTELSARTQQVLLSIEIFTLVLFAVVALVKVYANHPAGSIEPTLDWFNPFSISSFNALTGGVLLGIFIYWGWDSGVAVNEESSADGSNGPGKSAVISTVLLVLIYLLVTTAAQAFAGRGTLVANPDDIFAPIGNSVLGSVLDKLLIICVLTSASASTQTTILPTARTSLSMARMGAIPKRFAHIHPRNLTPDVSTIWMGAASAIVFFFLTLGSENLVFDAFTALGLMIAFYYGITGFACVVYYRRELTKSWKNFLFIGVLPFLGGLSLTGVLVKSFYNLATDTDQGYAKPLFGISAPFWIAVGFIVLGAILLIVCIRKYPAFFRRKAEVASPELVARAPASQEA
jgi:amino acid transporter